MKNRSRFFRLAVVAALTSLAAGAALAPAARAIPVIDAGGIAQVALQWGQIKAQLDAARSQVEALRSAARQLDPRSYQQVQHLLSGNDVNYLALTRDLQSMGYAFDRLDARYRQIFPDDKAIESMSPERMESTSREMNTEIHSSALVAARAQTTLRTIEDNNAEARQILSRSAGNDSQVAQLQSALQMLGLIHHNLVSINQIVATSSRVTSNQAVRGVTERRIARERSERLMRDYATRETIPDLDPRLFKSW